MITGVGLDVCEISRMEKLLEREGFVRRFFTMEEEKYIRTRGKGAAGTLAGLFAAREALGKALGSGIDFDLREAEVRHDEKGRPYFAFHGALAERVKEDRFHLSISHDGGVAAAMCVREKGDLPDNL